MLINNQNEFLIDVHRLMREKPELKYELLYRCSRIVRGKGEPLPRTQLKRLRREFVHDHVVRKRFRMAEHCYLDAHGTHGIFTVRHHIIPLSKWGCNRRINIITLCDRCHRYFHPWLKD